MKRFFVFLLLTALFLSLCGCTKFIPETAPTELTDDEISLQQQETIKIGFALADDHDDYIREVLTPEELLNWQNPYKIYSSYYFYGTLEGDEKIVYKALEYALVHSYERTLIDSRIQIEDKHIEEIMEYLSFDTPLLEQNLMHIIGQHNAAFYDYEFSEQRTVKVLHRSTAVYVYNFAPDLWEKKMLALGVG